MNYFTIGIIHADLAGGMIPANRDPLFFMFATLLVTFVATRVITRRIRAGSKGLKNWEVGGVHVHHEVFGVIAMILAGSLEFAYRPAEPWTNVLAALFGFGVSLTLDEFALWLHLNDVYWSPEGRSSIDAVFIAIVLTGLLLVGETPVDFSTWQHDVLAVAVPVTILDLVLSVITILKGKPILGIISLMIPILAIVGAIRLAKPSSQWSRWRYAPGSKKLARARERFGPAYQARWNRVRDFVGGTPSTVDSSP